MSVGDLDGSCLRNLAGILYQQLNQLSCYCAFNMFVLQLAAGKHTTSKLRKCRYQQGATQWHDIVKHCPATWGLTWKLVEIVYYCKTLDPTRSYYTVRIPHTARIPSIPVYRYRIPYAVCLYRIPYRYVHRLTACPARRAPYDIKWIMNHNHTEYHASYMFHVTCSLVAFDSMGSMTGDMIMTAKPKDMLQGFTLVLVALGPTAVMRPSLLIQNVSVKKVQQALNRFLARTFEHVIIWLTVPHTCHQLKQGLPEVFSSKSSNWGTFVFFVNEPLQKEQPHGLACFVSNWRMLVKARYTV